MKLSDIIKNCGVTAVMGSAELEITSVTNDSRKAGPGCLFIAVNGCGNDGRQYIDKAIANGAAAVMFEDGGETAGEAVSSLAILKLRAAAKQFCIMSEVPATIRHQQAITSRMD